jgi:hypothetical protein
MQTKSLPLKAGTRVKAVRNLGSVREGAFGIVTGTSVYRDFWRQKQTYLCTFADNMKIAARPNEIEEYDHGYTLVDFEQPDFERHVWHRRRHLDPLDPLEQLAVHIDDAVSQKHGRKSTAF